MFFKKTVKGCNVLLVMTIIVLTIASLLSATLVSGHYIGIAGFEIETGFDWIGKFGMSLPLVLLSLTIFFIKRKKIPARCN